MPRQKSIDTDTLIKFLDEYRLDNPGVKIPIPKFGEYVRAKGYKVQDFTIRRDEQFRHYLDSINKDTDQEIYSELVMYKTLDIEAFLSKNRTKDQLKEALSVRDKYYAGIAAKGADAIKAKRAAERKLVDLEARNAELEASLKKVQFRADNVEMRKKNQVIARLRAILESYVYPDAANAILKKEGILEVINSVIPDEIMEEKTLHAGSEYKTTKYDSLNNLLGGFDE